MRKGGEVFLRPKHPLQRRYEALRAYLVEGLSPREIQRRFGYSPASIHVLAVRFRKEGVALYFRDFVRRGPHDRPVVRPLREEILELRLQGLSGRDIAERLTARGRPISHPTVWLVLKEEGIGRLPRRTRAQREAPL